MCVRACVHMCLCGLCLLTQPMGEYVSVFSMSTLATAPSSRRCQKQMGWTLDFHVNVMHVDI